MIAQRRSVERSPSSMTDSAKPDGPGSERAMLLQLARKLESWPVRNLAYRHALDGVAQKIIELARFER